MGSVLSVEFHNCVDSPHSLTVDHKKTGVVETRHGASLLRFGLKKRLHPTPDAARSLRLNFHAPIHYDF
jgi:hypothetical protein